MFTVNGCYFLWPALVLHGGDCSVPFIVKPSWLLRVFVKDLTNLKKHFLTSICLLPLFNPLLKVLLQEAYAITWKGRSDPLLIAPQTNALLLYTLQIFNHNPPCYCSRSLCNVYSIWPILRYNMHSSQHSCCEECLTSSGNRDP